MARLKRSQEETESRTKRQEALAARVRERAEAALRALRAASKDRQAIHEIEWKQTNHDTLGDIDEIGGVLQGLAAWVTSGSQHRDPEGALNRLSKIRAQGFKARSLLLEHCKRCKRLWEYLGRQEELRNALEGFFEEETQSRVVPIERARHGRQGIKRSA